MSEFQAKLLRMAETAMFLATGVAMLVLSVSKGSTELHAVGLGALFVAATLAGVSPLPLLARAGVGPQLIEEAKKILPMAAVCLAVATLAGCPTMKAIQRDCGIPAEQGAITGAVDGLAADLSTGEAPTQAEWEARAVALALRYGGPALWCAAQHLIHDLEAGQLAAAAKMSVPQPSCHRLRREHLPFLRYLIKRGPL